MTCEELRDEYGAYSLGIAEDPERSEIAEHVARNCPECLRGVRTAMATVTAMSGTVESVAPPKHLRGRVVGMVERETKRPLFGFVLPWAIGAVLAIALLAVLFRPNPELAIMNDVDGFAVAPSAASSGRVFVSRSKGVVFIGAGLPMIEANRIFELWVIPAKGNPVPAGTFRGEADATAVYVRPGPVPGDVAAVAVTVEPAGGSPQPTTTPFLVMKL